MELRLKRLPAIWETWVRSLGREDPLEKEILLCLATMWFRPAAILLELDFLSLCLETRVLRNTYLDHLLIPETEEKWEEDFKNFIYSNYYL